MFRKFTAILLVCVLLYFSVMPVHGAEEIAIYQSNLIMQEMEEIDALISLAGAAARAGDLETAYRYEELLKSYDVVVSTDDFQISDKGAEINATGVGSYFEGIWVPPDTDAVHWYTTKYEDFYHYSLNKYYDLVCLRAESWDDTSGWLHKDYKIEKNSQKKSFVMSATSVGGTKLVEVGLSSVPGFSALLTISDLFFKANKKTQDYYLLELNAGDMTCMLSADMSISFWFVRSNGSSDGYKYTGKQNKVMANYGYVANTRFVQYSGQVDTKNITGNADVEYRSSGYNNMYLVCEAFKNGALREDGVGDFVINIIGEQYVLTEMIMPPTYDMLGVDEPEHELM